MLALRVGAAALATVVTTVLVPVAAQAAMDETLIEANVARKSTTVSYADLNLSNADHVAKLNARVARAASNICVNPAERDLSRHRLEIECRDGAIAAAQPQVLAAVERAGQTQFAARAATITVAMP